MLERHATLMSHKWDYTTHTRCMQKVTKPAMERAKVGPKSHKKGPEPSFKSTERHAPLEGQKCKQTKIKREGATPSDLRPQNHIPTTENPLDFSG